MKHRPRCYHGCDKPARKGYRFCSQRCAAEYAEELVMGNDDAWCPKCKQWVYVDLGFTKDKDYCLVPSCREKLVLHG